MSATVMNICIGGEAGQGLVTIGQVLGRALVRKGYHLHVTQAYESRIRGGHNTFTLRTGTVPVAAPTDEIDLLLALDAASLALYPPRMTQKALTVHSAALEGTAPFSGVDGGGAVQSRRLSIPMTELAPAARENTIMLGVAGLLLGLEEHELADTLALFLSKQSAAVIEENRAILAGTAAWLAKQGVEFAPLPAPHGVMNGKNHGTEPESGGRLMLHGNEALALGALAAGLTFYAFYPMSPATSVSMSVAAAAKSFGVVLEQAEDEIAAVTMALGASYAGARAMTATSGGGFALMTEGVSLAGALELPVVIVVAMRPGPATGLPTRTEQGDLECVLHAGHGEFPRAIFAPGSPRQCFELARRAFEQAESHQSPVFVLTDQYLADSYRDCPPLVCLSGEAPPPPLQEHLAAGHPGLADDSGYERYAITESGLSPRLLPGMGKALVVCDSDEHSPDGHITEDLSMRVLMQNKRLRKLQGLERDAVAPAFSRAITLGTINAPCEQSAPKEQRTSKEGVLDALGVVNAPETLLVCWGSTLGAVEEAAEILRRQGRPVAACHFSQVWPLRPKDFLPRFKAAAEVVMVEGNATGQLAALIRRETGFAVHRKILRYDGLPITARYIIDAMGKEGE